MKESEGSLQAAGVDARRMGLVEAKDKQEVPIQAMEIADVLVEAR